MGRSKDDPGPIRGRRGVKRVWGELLGRELSPMEWARAGLSAKYGGLGLQLAADRMDAAAWAVLTAALPVADRVLPWNAVDALLTDDASRN